jgi:hypothetical protein
MKEVQCGEITQRNLRKEYPVLDKVEVDLDAQAIRIVGMVVAVVVDQPEIPR